MPAVLPAGRSDELRDIVAADGKKANLVRAFGRQIGDLPYMAEGHPHISTYGPGWRYLRLAWTETRFA